MYTSAACDWSVFTEEIRRIIRINDVEMYGSSLGVYFVVIPEEFVEMFLEITVFPLAVVVVGEAVMSSPISSSPPLLLFTPSPLPLL